MVCKCWVSELFWSTRLFFFFWLRSAQIVGLKAAPGLGNDGEYKFGKLRRATSKEIQKYDLM